MNVKRIMICATASCFLLTGCSSSNKGQNNSRVVKETVNSTAITTKREKEDTNYVIRVTTKCNKGAGGEQWFPISKNLCFYESSEGHWTTTETEGLKRYKSENLVLKIEDFNSKNVTFSYQKDGKLVSKTLGFSEQFPINSNYDTYDGKKYSYRITFSDMDNLMVNY